MSFEQDLTGAYDPDDFDWDSLALWGDVAGHQLDGGEKTGELSLIERLVEVRPVLDPAACMAEIQEKLGFEDRLRNLVITDDPIGLVRRLPDGRLERYLEKHVAERLKGSPESAAYGWGHIDDQKVVVYSMNWKFMGGSLGAVAGEKFQRAAEVARKDSLPLVALLTSGGVRQQENMAGLVQMERVVEGIRHFKKSTGQPYIAVLVGEVWGGISASAVPLADLTVSLAGTNYGFSGPRVIGAFEGSPPPGGSQSAENNMLDRNIDVLVRDPDELISYLGGFMKSIRQPDKDGLKADSIPELHAAPRSEPGRIIDLGRAGVAAALYENQEIEVSNQILPEELIHPDNPKDEALMKRYESFIRSPARVDSEFVIKNVFSEVTPLYNHYVDEGNKVYPAIISAIGKIGPQPFLVIGNQPSYYKTADGEIRKIPSTPAPKDVEYARRMLKLGERLKLPVLFLTDTLGAMPTIDSESRGISRSLAGLIHDANDYPYPVMTVVLSALGSGGGLVTGPRGDYRAMLEDSHGYVAEPKSATSILYKKPEREDTMLTLSSMSATAEDQLNLKIIDSIIQESADPYETLKNIHDAIARIYPTFKSGRRLRRSRSSRIRSMRGMPIGRL